MFASLDPEQPVDLSTLPPQLRTPAPQLPADAAGWLPDAASWHGSALRVHIAEAAAAGRTCCDSIDCSSGTCAASAEVSFEDVRWTCRKLDHPSAHARAAVRGIQVWACAMRIHVACLRWVLASALSTRQVRPAAASPAGLMCRPGDSKQLEMEHVDNIPWQQTEIGQGCRLITMPDAMYCIVPGWLPIMTQD